MFNAPFFFFALTTYKWSRAFSRLRKTAAGTLLLFAMLFDVGGATSFRKYGHKTCHQGRCHPRFHRDLNHRRCRQMASPLWLPRRLKEAPGIKRLGYLQQKLPLSLHRMGILKVSEVFVCSISHTILQMEQVHALTQKLADRLRDILVRLDASATAADMDLPGFRLLPLKGEMKGFWAVTVRANWRVIFRFADGDAFDLDYLDYH